MRLTSGRADAARIHGTGMRSRNSSAFRVKEREVGKSQESRLVADITVSVRSLVTVLVQLR
jgi:hypothetical protein